MKKDSEKLILSWADVPKEMKEKVQSRLKETPKKITVIKNFRDEVSEKNVPDKVIEKINAIDSSKLFIESVGVDKDELTYVGVKCSVQLRGKKYTYVPFDNGNGAYEVKTIYKTDKEWKERTDKKAISLIDEIIKRNT